MTNSLGRNSAVFNITFLLNPEMLEDSRFYFKRIRRFGVILELHE